MEEDKILKQPFVDENNKLIEIGVSDNLEKLKVLFPNVIKDGFVDFDALKEELGEIKEIENQKYELTWWGKQKAKQEAMTPPIGKTLNYKENGNDNFKGDTKNLYIEGDNLETLKLLRENYYGKIKMIYIDPPYNTGKDFIYKDSFKMSKDEVDKAEGIISDDGEQLEKRFVQNSEGNRYHSNWLNMMYPRLKLAHSLLKDDGVIFISIDDNELSNLIKICDEVFGNSNFIAQITTRSNPGGRDYGGIAITHEYVLCYAKSDIGTELNLISDEHKVFPFSDNIGGFETRELRNRNTKFNIDNRPNLCYPFFVDKNNIDDSGLYSVSLIEDEKYNIRVMPLISQGIQTVWRWGKPKSEENANVNVKAKRKNDGTFMIVEKYRSTEKRERSIWDEKNIRNEAGSLTIKELMHGKQFDYPKSVDLIKRCIILGSKSDDIILDFFSGSATTAHAVMQLNAEDGGNRQHIMVQLPEICNEDSEAYKAGYKNICEIGKERIRRAGDKIVEELHEKNKKYVEEKSQITLDNLTLLNDDIENDISNDDKDKYIKNPELLDIGFKVFEVGKTNIKWNNVDSMEDIMTLEQHFLQGKDKVDFTPHFTDLNVVYEIALQYRGVPLSSKVEKLSDIGDRTYLYANSYLICLEENITEDIVRKISKITPQPISYYFRDSAFEDNIALKDDTIRTFKDLILINYSKNKSSYTVEFI